MNRFITAAITCVLVFASLGVQARFSQLDSYEGKLHEPVTLHKYNYSHNDPVNWTDPSGNIATTSDLLQAMNLQGVLTTTGTHASYRVILKNVGTKMACIAIEEVVGDLILQQLTGGIYIFEDSKPSPSKPYVGSTKDFKTRLRQHAKSKTKNVKKVLSMFHMAGDKNTLRLVEQFFMDVLEQNNVETSNRNRAIAEKPRSRNSKELRGMLKKLDFCK